MGITVLSPRDRPGQTAGGAAEDPPDAHAQQRAGEDVNDLDRIPPGVNLTHHFGTGFRLAFRVTRGDLIVGYIWLAHAPPRHGARIGRARRPIRWEYGRVLGTSGVGHRHTRWRSVAAVV